MKKLLIIAVLVLSGCTTPFYFSTSAPPGPPEYQQGWKDGCESGRSAYANHFYKMFLSLKQDEELAQNPVYYQVWKDAYTFCWQYQENTSAHGLGNFK